GFDPAMWMYAEDLDLCWRLRQKGWSTRYVPEATATHEVAASTGQRWDEAERLQRTQAATYGWLAKRRGERAARRTALAYAVGPAARIPLLPVGAGGDRTRFGWRLERQKAYAKAHAANVIRPR